TNPRDQQLSAIVTSRPRVPSQDQEKLRSRSERRSGRPLPWSPTDLVFARRSPGFDDDAVVDDANAWCICRRTLRSVALEPRADRAGQRGAITGNGHADVTRIDVGISMQGLDDAVPDIALDRTWCDGNAVHDVVHSADVADGAFGIVL